MTGESILFSLALEYPQFFSFYKTDVYVFLIILLEVCRICLPFILVVLSMLLVSGEKNVRWCLSCPHFLPAV